MVDAVGTCARCASPLERGDLRCAICAELAPAPAERRAAVEVEVLRCAECSAVVAYDPDARAPRCAFCDAVMQLETAEDPPEQTELFLPFTVDRAQAAAAVRTWLGSLGWFRPGDLRERARVTEVRPLWWVGWAFDADALVSWAADSDAGSGRAAWAPHAGQVRMTFDDIVVPASRGLTEKEAAELVPRYALASGLPAVEPPEGTLAEQFDVPRSEARARVAAAIERLAAARVEKGHVPGRSFRNVRAVPLVRALVTRRYSFPAWVMAYRYRDEVYRAVVCGQDAGRVLGKAPYSFWRIAGAVLLGLLILLFALVGILVTR